MSKKVLYLGNGKWCWTESCRQHAAAIASKNKYIAAVEKGSSKEIAAAITELNSTAEGVSTFRHLRVKEMKKGLGRTPTLGLDGDNTSADFTHGLRSWMGTKAKLPQEEWLKHFPEPDEYAMWQGKNAWYRDKEHFLEEFQAAEQMGLYRDLPVYENASTVLTELKSYGFNIKLVTARKADFNDDTRAWMVKSIIPVKQIINPCENKHKIKNIDAYMDDSPHVIKTLLDNQKKVVVMNQDYNAINVAGHENARRVHKWDDDVVEAIFDLLDKRNNK